MFLADRLTIDAPKRTSAGYLAVRAKAARSGVYDYAGSEVDPANAHGLRDQAVVKVYRPIDQVFDRKSIASFIGKPITDNHPSVAVTSENWRDHARGTVMGAVRDGDYVSFDLLLTDAAAIDSVESGKRELSNGYSVDLKFEPGTTPEGAAFDAVQTSIMGNHIALVDHGRAGPECRISDSKFAVCDANPARVAELFNNEGKTMSTITIDGIPVNLGDEAAVQAVIAKYSAAITDGLTNLDKALADVATLTADKANLEAEKVTLNAQVADAKVTPAQLRDAAKAYAAVCDKAKALGVNVADEADASEIMKAVVDAKIGDAAKEWTADQVAASFATLTADVKASDHNVVNITVPASMKDAEANFADVQAKQREARRNAWKQQA